MFSDNSQKIWVKFWGVRGSRDTDDREIGGYSTCVEVQVGGERLMIDAGGGSINFGKQLMGELFAGKKIELHALFTHLHEDHIAGLRFFSPLFHPNFSVNLWSRQGMHRILRKHLFDGNTFPVTQDMLKGRMSCALVNDGSVIVIPTSEGKNIVVEACAINHPGGCFGYRIEYDGAAVAIIMDHEEYDPNCANPEEGQRLERNLVELMTGADLVIIEAQYTDEVYVGTVGGVPRKGWGSRAGESPDRSPEAQPAEGSHHDAPRSGSWYQGVRRTSCSRCPNRHWHQDLLRLPGPRGSPVNRQTT
jgi:phosphoribosyl 1,2-cyclic phosphodiesterase